MATLGDLLSSAKRSAGDFERWIDAADPAFAQQVRGALTQANESLADFAGAAVADFSRFADDESWAHLTTLVRDSEDPGLACLTAMVRWRLQNNGTRAPW